MRYNDWRFWIADLGFFKDYFLIYIRERKV